MSNNQIHEGFNFNNVYSTQPTCTFIKHREIFVTYRLLTEAKSLSFLSHPLMHVSTQHDRSNTTATGQ